MAGREKVLRPGWALRLFPAVLVTVAVFLLGTATPAHAPRLDFHWGDKVGHFFAFGFVQITYARSAGFLWPELCTRKLAWRAACASALLGLLLEVVQGFLPYRSAEFADFVADGVGAVFASVLYIYLSRWQTRYERD